MTNFLSTKDLCNFLGISLRTLFRYIEEGLPKIQVYEGVKLFFDREQVESWLKNRKIRKTRKLKF